jgi:uncharacterized delta-60 repeat protein
MSFFVSAFAAIVLTAMLSNTVSAAGQLDPQFGTGGKVTVPLPNQGEFASSMEVQSDGKIVVAGIDDQLNFVVARYTPTGELDVTFGTAGVVSVPMLTTSYTVGLAIQSDGKIVITGTLNTPADNDIVVIRFDSDGTLDPLFGSGGIVITDIFGTGDFAAAVAIQPDGMIVVGGICQVPGSGNDLAVLRYDTSGNLDPGFGNGGVAIIDFNGQADILRDIAIQTDGKIVTVGSTGSGDVSVARSNGDGTPDLSFGTDGKTTIDMGGSDEANAVAIQEDGKIVVAGRAGSVGPSANFGIARLHGNGELDIGFGSNGKVTTDFNGFGDTANDVAVQPDGKIVAVGLATIYADLSSGDLDFGIARYLSDGSPDPTFGTDGKVMTPLLGSEAATAVAVLGDCSILAAGFSVPENSSDTHFALAKYDGGGCASAAPCPNGQGYWKNNSSLWPVNMLALGNHSYTKQELLAILNNSTTSDASIIMARQLIAAKLNAANGAEVGSVEAVIMDADVLLAGYSGKLALKVKPKSSAGQAFVNVADVLDAYNNGQFTPSCSN